MKEPLNKGPIEDRHTSERVNGVQLANVQVLKSCKGSLQELLLKTLALDVRKLNTFDPFHV